MNQPNDVLDKLKDIVDQVNCNSDAHNKLDKPTSSQENIKQTTNASQSATNNIKVTKYVGHYDIYLIVYVFN